MILGEFVFGTVGGAALGVWALTWGDAAGVIVGVWLLGLAVNYLPLTVHVLSLWSPPALEAELAGIDLRTELRDYTRAQVWVLVPFWVGGLALTQSR